MFRPVDECKNLIRPIDPTSQFLERDRERVGNFKACISRAAAMEILEQNLDEFFNLNPYFAEMYTSSSSSSQASPHEAAADQLVNTGCWNGQEISPNSSTVAAAAAPPPPPQLISFDKESRYEDYKLTPKIINFSSPAEDDSGKRETATRTPSQAQDHLMSERKRRDNLRQLFIALSKVVPGLRKLDKASLLEDAINHLKALQERVVALEREEMMMMGVDDHNMRFSYTGNSEIVGAPPPPPAEISVRSEEGNVLIKMFCKKKMDLMSTIPSQLESIHLHVTDIRIMPFGPAAFDVTILAQMKSEFVGTVEDIVEQLRAVVGTPTQIQ